MKCTACGGTKMIRLFDGTTEICRECEPRASPFLGSKETAALYDTSPLRPHIGDIVMLHGPRLIGEICGVVTLVLTAEGDINVLAMTNDGALPMRNLAKRGATPDKTRFEWSWRT